MKKILTIVMLCLIPLGALLLLLAQNVPGFAEGYAAAVYPVWSRGVNFVTSLLPFSLAEFLVYLAVPAALFFLIRFAARMIGGKGRRGKLLKRFSVNVGCLLGVLLFFFTVNCGINYHRDTFAQASGLPVEPSSEEELISLCQTLLEDVNRERRLVREDENGVMKLSFESDRELAETVRQAYDGLESQYPTLRSGYGPPKAVLASRGMSYLDITGVFFAYTFEANVNVDEPDYSIPATMGHELSHLRGYMREDEANFLGYLCCRESSHPDLRYSAAMLAFTHATNQLYRQDPEAAQEIFDGMEEGVRRDRAYNSAYWERFEGRLSEVSRTVNNTYLQANSQEDGVQSYGRMVDLLLADQRQKSSK